MTFFVQDSYTDLITFNFLRGDQKEPGKPSLYWGDLRGPGEAT